MGGSIGPTLRHPVSPSPQGKGILFVLHSILSHSERKRERGEGGGGGEVSVWLMSLKLLTSAKLAQM